MCVKRLLVFQLSSLQSSNVCIPGGPLEGGGPWIPKVKEIMHSHAVFLTLGCCGEVCNFYRMVNIHKICGQRACGYSKGWFWTFGLITKFICLKAMRTELVITCVTSCVSFVWIVFLVKKRLDRFKRLDRLNDRSFGSF